MHLLGSEHKTGDMPGVGSYFCIKCNRYGYRIPQTGDSLKESQRRLPECPECGSTVWMLTARPLVFN